MRVDGVRRAEEEEVHESGYVGLAALRLDHAYDLVVRSGMELDENLADHAHAWLGPVVLQGQAIEGVNGALAETIEVLGCHARGDDLLGIGHALVVERVGRARFHLVGTHAIEVCMMRSP